MYYMTRLKTCQDIHGDAEEQVRGDWPRPPLINLVSNEASIKPPA